MNIKQAKEEIKNTIAAYFCKDDIGEYMIPPIRQRPILLMGPPGIGKTQIMEQIAKECGIGLVSYTITHHTRQSAVGLPFIKEEQFEGRTYSVTEYTMSEIIASVYHCMKEGNREGILFIDEINCVSETLAPTMLEFLQCKRFGNQEVPPGWVIVAAGNPPEYNKAVRDFDIVTLDRVRYIPVEADFEVWQEYAKARRLHGAVLSYLDLKRNNFYKIEADVDGMHFVTARGWEDLSSLMRVYEEQGIPVTKELVMQFLHQEDVAEDAAAYFDLYYKYQDDYGIEDILQGYVKPWIYESLERADFDERLSVVNQLLDGLGACFLKVFQQKCETDEKYEALKLYCNEIESPEEENIHFNKKKAEFMQQVEYLEELEDAAGEALEHAFDFMEQAFAKGQEMVVFVTGLTLEEAAVSFLAEHECERYLKYNEELLIGTKRTQLLTEMER